MTTLTATEAEALIADAQAVMVIIPNHFDVNKTQSELFSECELIAKVWKATHLMVNLNATALPVPYLGKTKIKNDMKKLRATLNAINAIDYGRRAYFSPSWTWYELV
jgi:hypothetical protein